MELKMLTKKIMWSHPAVKLRLPVSGYNLVNIEMYKRNVRLKKKTSLQEDIFEDGGLVVEKINVLQMFYLSVFFQSV